MSLAKAMKAKENQKQEQKLQQQQQKTVRLHLNDDKLGARAASVEAVRLPSVRWTVLFTPTLLFQDTDSHAT